MVESEGFVRSDFRTSRDLTPHTVLKLIAEGKLSLDERFVIRRADAQAYEYVQDYESAITLLSDFTLELAQNQNRDMTTVPPLLNPGIF